VLLAIGERVRQALRRPTDIAAQYGGDEFTILLPEATIEDAQRTYRYLQAEIEGPIHPIDRISFSCGIAALKPDESANAFFGRADEALRRAKGPRGGGAAGKGRMELAE
jgi:diguanylate cyclase (GGDEF)-like protein